MQAVWKKVMEEGSWSVPITNVIAFLDCPHHPGYLKKKSVYFLHANLDFQTNNYFESKQLLSTDFTIIKA